ncbi:MAG: hypothetical protein PHS31_02850 [Victivallaceae bacterium]|nr:hypothetical protein [Victivallaceae bacterium]MDD4180607.1 hypothetical protein [Victivallaceae bacterium]
MAKKLQYVNCRGDVYFVRCVEGKKGKRYVCSKKENATDLTFFPDGYEFSENPNGIVSFRRKLNSLITPEEMKLAEELVAELAAPDLVKFEKKEDAIIVYSHKRHPDLSAFMGITTRSQEEVQNMLSNLVRYEPVLKFDLLEEKGKRQFVAYRMTWRGDCDWMFLSMGSLRALIKKYAPHIEKESFFDLL